MTIMVAKAAQEAKRERNRAKRAKIDLITNKYMINLSWGIFVIILLRFVESGYMSTNTVLTMPGLMKTCAVIFAVAAAGLFACGKMNIAKRKGLFYGYSAFAFVLTLGSLWIGFFGSIRNFFVELYPALINLDSRWWISRGPIVLIAVYLIVTLILTTIKVALVERGK